MFNLVVLIGNLGADPEIRTTPSGVKVAKMRLAVNDSWTNRQTGERETKTHWVDLNAWDRLAQTAERYLTRGQRICVRGTLEYREWQSQEGQKRSKLEVRVRELYMLSPRDQRSGGGQQPYDNNYQQQPKNNQAGPPGGGYNNNYGNNPPQNFNQGEGFEPNTGPLEDDDIPF